MVEGLDRLLAIARLLVRCGGRIGALLVSLVDSARVPYTSRRYKFLLNGEA